MTRFELKILWALDINTDSNITRVLDHAAAAGCKAICVRTAGKGLPDLIAKAHASGIQVYAWRWPARRPQPKSTTHYYAEDEAKFVAQVLIPVGLDGYVVDPESDGPGQSNDWNDASLAPLARTFCEMIRTAAAGNPKFRFGLTSGCAYPSPTGKPDIPWAPFVAASDVLLPQTYWRVATDQGDRPANGGNPQKAIDRGVQSWTRIAAGKRIVPMAGELGSVTEQEIAAYGDLLAAAGIREAHFYIDGSKISATRLAAIKNL